MENMLENEFDEMSRFNTLQVSNTNGCCRTGEIVGSKNTAEGKIPVIACEGGCIRGEIARLAANFVAKKEPF